MTDKQPPAFSGYLVDLSQPQEPRLDWSDMDNTVSDERKALLEIVEAHEAPYPSESAGMDAQDAWATRRDVSIKQARALLALKAEQPAAQGEPVASVFLQNLHYFFAQTDGTYKWPEGSVGDLLKQAKREIEAHPSPAAHVPQEWIDTISHAVSELEVLDDATAQIQSDALRELLVAYNKPPAQAVEQAVAAKRHQSITLNGKEIKDLAEFVGLEIAVMDYSEVMNTDITVSTCPDAGVLDDDGRATHYGHVAYLTEYPEEGTIPLGDEIAACKAGTCVVMDIAAKMPTRQQQKTLEKAVAEENAIRDSSEDGGPYSGPCAKGTCCEVLSDCRDGCVYITRSSQAEKGGAL